MQQKYIVEKDKVYVSHKDNFFEGYAPVNPDVPKGTPYLSYTGPKILIGSTPEWEFHGQGYTWREVQAFFIWVYKDCKSECQVRGYINEEAKQWRFWAFPQEHGTGLSAKEIPEKCDIECNKVGLFSKNGWLEFGTIHSHGNIKASQSGTDANNEISKVGLHVTIGDVDEPVHSIDGRMTFREQFYGVNWWQWFVAPEGLTGLPWRFQDEVMQYFLRQAPPDDYPFPEAWKDNMIKKVYGPPYGGMASYRGRNDDDWHKDQSTGEWFKQGEKRDGKEEKKPIKLSKKEEKRIRKLIKKKGFDEDLLPVEEAAKVHAAATQVLRICSVYDVEPSELFRRIISSPTLPMSEKLKTCLDEFEDILWKNGVDADAIEDWILGIEEVPTDGELGQYLGLP